ncbi:MAG: tetratricopeptide repeat protein [Pseudomonadota bacterium]
MKYAFDKFVLDTERFELTDESGELVDLQPRSLELLALLLRNPGALVDKETTQQEIWGGLHTSPDAMRTQVRKLRAALGDTQEPHRLIETVRGKGLRFVGAVTADSGMAAASTEEEPEEAQSAPSDDLIASPPAETNPSRRQPAFMAVLGALAVAIMIVAWFGVTSRENTAQSAQSRPFDAAIAVLPFREVGGQSNQAYLGEGVADELSNVLARINGFKVSSSSSAFRFSDMSNTTIAETAETLGVTHVIEGSFARVGPSLKVTVNLIDAAADDRIWTATYDRPYNTANVVRLQEQIVSEVVSEMAGELVTPSQLPRAKTQSSRALDLYYRAKSSLRAQTSGSITQAIEYLKKAIEIDPNYVDPYSLLVLAYEDAYYVAGLSWEEANAARREALAKALELAPKDNDVLIANAIITTDDGDSREAIAMFQRALAVDPNNAYTLSALAFAYTQIGRRKEALNLYRRARDIDPLNPAVLHGLTIEEFSRGNTQDALDVARVNARWNSENPAVQENLAWMLLKTGEYTEAHALFATVLRDFPKNDAFALEAAKFYLRLGSEEKARSLVATAPNAKAQIDAMLGDRAAVERFLADNPDPDTVGNETGILHFYLRDFDTALPFMKRTIEELELTGSADMAINELVWFLAHAHVLCEVADPDCDALLEKMEKSLFAYTPQTADSYDVFVAGAGTQMLRGNDGAAIDWLEAALEDGHTFVHLNRNPLFEPLLKTDRYKALMSKMEAKATKYRALIKEQPVPLPS